MLHFLNEGEWGFCDSSQLYKTAHGIEFYLIYLCEYSFEGSQSLYNELIQTVVL